MPTVTVIGAGVNMAVNYATNDAAPYSSALAGLITNSLMSGDLTPYQYNSGAAAPGPATGTNGLAMITTTPATAVAIPVTDSAVVVSTAGPVSISGGAPGSTVVAGSGGLSYTGITPSGTDTTSISAGDGPNLISTMPGTTGNYQVNTGSGNDTVSVSGSAVINAATGDNDISLGDGNSYIYSEGHDSITGSTVAGASGTDTINIGSGQATVNPGNNNLFIYATHEPSNPLLVMPGSGSDTISVGTGGGSITAGTGGNSILFGGIGGVQSAETYLQGTANGDQLFAIGAGNVTATAGAGAETITGAGGAPNGFTVPSSTGNNLFTAGSGNDTLIAGGGADTLVGGAGQALMESGTGPDIFAFTSGNGSQATISGFKPTDTLQLTGFGVTTVPSTVTGGSVIALADGTTITFTGLTKFNPSQLVLK